MMELTVTCCMCGKTHRDEKVYVGLRRQLDIHALKERLEGLGWIVQFNGDNIDTYCSNECAK